MSSSLLARRLAACALVGLFVASPSFALQPRSKPSRFDAFVKPAAVLPGNAEAAAALPGVSVARRGWDAFVAEQGGGWQGWFDTRTGLPLLVQGRGIPWLASAKEPATLERLETLARGFVDAHPFLLGTWKGQLVLDRAASGRLGDNGWQVTFRQAVGGVPVADTRFDFHVVQGNLVAFGASRWATVQRGATPSLSAGAARAALDRALGAAPGELAESAPAVLQFVARDPRGTDGAVWDGAVGSGLTHALAWRFTLREPGAAPTWVADVDADSGALLAFYDDTKYDRIMGGVFPVSDDGLCPTGCEQAGWPMPFADFSEDGGPVQYTGSHGMYACQAIGSQVRTTLAGQYVRVSDTCGQANELTTCDNPQDLLQGPGTDCDVPPGHSAGDTHAGRSSFYHLNRVMEKGRAWLPGNAWLKSQLLDNINIFSTCNAFWDGGSVNFYRSGGGCRNTGEIAGVFVHEWGHGIDNNDGGGYDNPSEAYADIVAFFETRESCVGRGFFMTDNCGGYGDACLNCTGIRDQDWNMHASHAPADVAWVNAHCGGGGGPCGKEPHCESYISAQAIWDLANRDLPAAGLDAASAWQLAEKLWYRSRDGSGGNAYNCGGSSADGCASTSWFNKFRLIDDDDGNLNNGTPHAAAIFAAFKRHGIACGNATDASNLNSGSCPALAKPVVTTKPLSNAVQLSWAAVPNASSYRILRNDIGCSRAQIIVGTAAAPATTYTDTDLSNDFTVYYRVQAVGANAACDSPVSDCQPVAPQPFAGSVKFDQATYGCSNHVGVRVNDANAGTPTVTVTVWSGHEAQPETVVCTETAPGSGKFVGQINTTGGPAVHGDGLLSIANGDTLTAQYIDADDGIGGHDVPRVTTAAADCVFPVISAVGTSNVATNSATVTWTTDETSDTVLVWGPQVPPLTPTSGNARTTAHRVDLSNLNSCTVYYYEVHSTDPAGNVAVSTNGGQYYHFETLKDFGFGPQPCHAGRPSFDLPVYACTSNVTFTAVDQDLNRNPNAVDTAFLDVTSTTEATPERVLVTETGPNTSIFTGAITNKPGAPAADGFLEVKNGDLVTVTYFDADDGTGHPATTYATASVDCAGPAVSNVRVDTITDARATIHFDTAELGDTKVEWGTTPALGQVSTATFPTFPHDTLLNQFTTCQNVYFRLRTRDNYGNEAVVDNNGAPFVFRTGLIPGLYWKESFENGTNGWTLGGEFEIGPPQGKGGSSGQPDPSSAYNNGGVLGDDLTGRGAHPGDYEASVTDSAKSPRLTATTWTHTKLIYYRRLQAGPGDEASIWVYNPVGYSAFRDSAGTFDQDYGYQSVDIAQVADGKAQVQLEFRQRTDASGFYSGWNVDDVILKDGTKPDYGPCADCSGAPSFAGGVSANDNNACAAAGVTVSWNAAAAWGSGGAGTYSVYRGTAPGFPADSAHRVGTGIAGLSFNDTTAPAGDQYYLVRAESNETCSTGPANHGVTDTNAIYVPVRKTTSRPAPGLVTGFTVSTVAKTHVRLTWAAPAEAATYNVYRSLTPQPGDFGRLATSAAPLFDDLGAGATRESYFYFVRAVNACGVEGP